MTKNIAKKISKMSFEEAMARLEEIVETLSSQKINLDSMIALYEEGNVLREHCNKRLEEAKMKIEMVK
ncbi:MAG: exodeoxyribonuclease VII small subunit [Alphaproteobacteria bacterium RIFCSPLOWO2_01_FULL_40_26]|nr:MAG: exodeoxyribonuclease VII small subunit [Alphaproteobacteria bacterium RIFCSPHIGHO2_02_FULL_40_34]OFW86080.1 MAG: exodeoxyribonuclease VII small subunit [Alphaproteobacteria bacterium RIFCSPHIGHO2_01_FULL_40_8]OFW95129.1 MAG: exodeoxyribonuclease VII small subunit [Alphaproteobacteria bacterium RIFCSPLOWO2_01_FULL_40_26]OFX09147.1 MAG: exodeoxyribonuclease VII small subunit [Alphaproteobacteria bacterium RIFCSPLOWO2_02_FULL_40_19]OFX12189.1 MAG: exodeoxyribonuclease VII small subunit [Al